jgi:hypothetical protein
MKVSLTIAWLSENELLSEVLSMKSLDLVATTADGIVVSDHPVAVPTVLTDGSTVTPDDEIHTWTLTWEDRIMFCPHELTELGFNCDN